MSDVDACKLFRNWIDYILDTCQLIEKMMKQVKSTFIWRESAFTVKSLDTLRVVSIYDLLS